MAVKTEVREGVTPPSALDPAALLRSPDYIKLLALAANTKNWAARTLAP